MGIPDLRDREEQLERLRLENDELRSRTFSGDQKLNRLLKTVVEEVKIYAEDQLSKIRRLTQIGLALSAEANIGKLLETIVDEARKFTNADAGTLYLLDKKEGLLRFEIVQNDTLDTKWKRTDTTGTDLPPIPLEINGKPNYGNVASYVTLTGEIQNIPDVYQTELFDFTGPRKYDARTGYRSRSMLIIPMRNHEGDIIGILQLLNAQDMTTGHIMPFSEEDVDLIASLASQAAVAITNVQLIQDLKNLFYSFIKSIATAIDQKSPYTGGHIRRVVELATLIADEINKAHEGPFADVHFTENEMEELRMAAWMHDVGKIVTPEHVIDKSTKLETICDRIHLVKTRFDLIRTTIENRYLREKLAMVERGMADGVPPARCQAGLEDELKILQEERDFIVACNSPAIYMDGEKIKRLNEIAQKTYELNNDCFSYLTGDEVYNLSIRKGTLTEEERAIIERHAIMTVEILKALPFPKHLSHLIEYASAHHEKLDGSGYPFGLTGDQLPLQAKIIAVADIFEALTSKDRPYKEPMKLSQAMKIFRHMTGDKQIDADIVELFVKSRVYEGYARLELGAEQIDEVL